MRISETRILLVSILRNPWLYLILFLTLFFISVDIGSTDQGRSGLISIATGENGRLLTCMWFLSALSVVTIPFLVLWQEQIITGLERSGYLPLLLTSRLPERRYRQSRLWTASSFAIVITGFTAFVGVATLSGLELATNGAMNFAVAALVIYIPNLVAGSILAARLTHLQERAVALALGIATPIVLITVVGLSLGAVPDGPARLWYAALEPTGTLFFAELYGASIGSGWGEPHTRQLLPLLLNRFVLLLAVTWLGWTYLEAPSVFDRNHGDTRPAAQSRPRRFSPFAASFTLGLFAALLTVSNIHSNFSKNLAFYQIEPSMGFLFAAAISEIYVYLVVAMLLLIGKIVWDSRETAFDVLEGCSKLSGAQVLLRSGAHLTICFLTFLLVVLGSIAMMFAGRWDAFSLSALLELMILWLLPGLLLIVAIYYLLSLLSPNRVTGYLVAIGLSLAYLGVRTSGFGNLSFSIFTDLPRWSVLTGGIAWTGDMVNGAIGRVGLAVILLGLCAVVADRWRLREPSWLSRRTIGLASVGLLGGAILAAAPLMASRANRTEVLPFEGTPETSARYETAAVRISDPDEWALEAVNHSLTEASSGRTVLRSMLNLRQRSQSPAPIPVTWAVEPEQIISVRVDGADTGYTSIAPGLFVIDDQSGKVELTLEAAMPSSDAIVVHSFYGFWPTMPVSGILPELFVRDPAIRERLGLPRTVADVDRFHHDGFSRATVRASVSVERDCRRAAAVPHVGEHLRASGACVETMSRDRIRNELFASIGHWSILDHSGDDGTIRMFYPSHQAEPARLLLESAAVAKGAVEEALGRRELSDLTIVAGGVGAVGSSNAISKPGVILVSDVTVLSSSLRGDERRNRYLSLMAHEITHQVFGHAVRPPTGVAGAIFVNEVPAELLRGYVIMDRLGKEAYGSYLRDVADRMRYTLWTQRSPDGAPIEATEADEIYFRAAALGAFVASQSGWDALTDKLAGIAANHAYERPLASRELAADLIEDLDPRARTFASLLVETDTIFEWSDSRESLSSTCSVNCPDATSVRFPVIAASGHTEWIPVAEVNREALSRSPVGALVIDR